MAEYAYNRIFSGNILVAGKTNFEKTTLVQKLGISILN